MILTMLAESTSTVNTVIANNGPFNQGGAMVWRASTWQACHAQSLGSTLQCLHCLWSVFWLAMLLVISLQAA